MAKPVPRSGPCPVEVYDLVARYGELEVLSGVDFELRPGEIHVVLGGSGCGKSTLLKHMIGLLTPAAGSVRLLGVDPSSADERQWEAVLARIGVLFQGGALLGGMTVHDNVALPIQERAGDLPPQVVDEMVTMKLALLGLAEAGPLLPSELSGGMKKRAALARAMALDPEILLCDEPSAGLDPVTAADLDRLILGLRDRFGMSVVVVSHELASIDAIADRVTMLAQGRVVASGPYRDVRGSQDPKVRAFFERTGKGIAGVGGTVLAALAGDAS